MGVNCDLHAIDHVLHTEVRTCQLTRWDEKDGGFVVVGLRVGDARANLYLSRDQAALLAQELTDHVARMFGNAAPPVEMDLEEGVE